MTSPIIITTLTVQIAEAELLTMKNKNMLSTLLKVMTKTPSITKRQSIA